MSSSYCLCYSQLNNLIVQKATYFMLRFILFIEKIVGFKDNEPGLVDNFSPGLSPGVYMPEH